MLFRFTQSVNPKLVTHTTFNNTYACMCIYVHIWTSTYISYMDDSFQKSVWKISYRKIVITCYDKTKCGSA